MTNREIDREMAEKVMGIRIIKNSDVVDLQELIDGKAMYASVVPKFSERIQDAFMVVEKMEKLGWLTQIQNGCTKPDVIFVELVNYEKEKVEQVYADTAPMAICLAAKEAIRRN